MLDFVQIIKGEGMPRFEDPSLHGDLYIEYTVVLPTTINVDQRRSEYILFQMVTSVCG